MKDLPVAHINSFFNRHTLPLRAEFLEAKKMLIRLAFLVTVALAAGCASTDAPMTADAPEYTKAEKAAMSTEEKAELYNASVQNDEDRVICRRYTPTGTRQSKTICRTVAEAEIERKAAQETLRKSRGTGLSPSD
jgi:hypothetical protein